MNRSLWLVVALVVLDLALILARGRDDVPVVASGKPVRVGLVFDVGGRGDKSFNDAAYLGVERARRELGAEVALIEPGDGADREAGIRLLAAQGFDLVFGVGFIFSDDMYAIAGEYPGLRFADIDYAKFGPEGFVVPPPNMVAIKFREEEGSYLVGAVAALKSTQMKGGEAGCVVGFVGGMDIPLIHKFEEGYRAGARAVVPGCGVLAAYAGVTGDAFKNPGKGKEMALSQYAQGADVIFHAAGSTGLGVFEAARSMERFAIGVDADQSDEAPGRVLTSMTKQVDLAVFETIRDVRDGKFRGGVRVFGLAEQGVDYVHDQRNAGMFPPGARDRVEGLRREIIAGRVVVPSEARR